MIKIKVLLVCFDVAFVECRGLKIKLERKHILTGFFSKNFSLFFNNTELGSVLIQPVILLVSNTSLVAFPVDLQLSNFLLLLELYGIRQIFSVFF